MEVRIEQIAIRPGTSAAFVSGRPVNDGTKVVVAAAEWRGAVLMAVAMAEGVEDTVVDIPDDAIVAIIEAP